MLLGRFASSLWKSVSAVVMYLVTALEKLLQLPRNIKQACLLLLDMVFVCVALYGAVALRLGTLAVPIGSSELICAAFTVFFSAVVFLRLGLYRAIIRFMGHQAIWAIGYGALFSMVSLGLMVFFTRAEMPRSVPLIYGCLLLFLVGGSRLIVRAYHQMQRRSQSDKVIIYGAGESGRQLLTALHHGNQYHTVVFVDDDPALQGSIINGLLVESPSNLEMLVREHDISQILLAMPSVSALRRKEIVDSLVTLPLQIRTVPRIHELVQGSAEVSEIQDISLEELLGRDPVPPRTELLRACITDKVVLVTGAGGSIGSELCRQILRLTPKELILFENNEYALYAIERELRAFLNDDGLAPVSIVPLLGSVQDKKRLQVLYRTYNIQTVYHAAAYKHVPLVEYNVIEGVANNVLGTWHAANEAGRAGVETFVLVSTDKAVRPTNIMGASKRFAEMLLQALADGNNKTRFCMVRFGNVLGSSGSVVPLFREQIAKGGPLTVTHPEVSRYFMSIPEAAQLVLQASAMAEGGDVFVLDMGKPVLIVDLARRMIQLHAARQADRGLHDNKDIPINFIGLRPGEKLHEELMLGKDIRGTGHPMIMRAEEEFLKFGKISAYLSDLTKYCQAMDSNGVRNVLREVVSGFDGYQGKHDHIWRKQQSRAVSMATSNVQELFPDQVH